MYRRQLEGELEELLEQGRRDAAAGDYLLVRLQDRHAILDLSLIHISEPTRPY